MTRTRTRALLILLCAFCLAASEHAIASHNDYLVGVYYFAGWWQKSPNKWTTDAHDWRPDYPRRAPILGQYNDQDTMDQEIIAASSRGVDFFQILWYPNGGPLNEGLQTFLASTNAARMKFTIEFVNHPPFDLSTDANWEAACKEWCAAMKHPSYLRIDGRPVFKIHGMDYFYKQNGDDPKKVRARLDTFRRIAKENGLSSPLISGGVMPGGVPLPYRAAPFDFRHHLHGYAGLAAEDGDLSLRTAHPARGGRLDSLRRALQQVLCAVCPLRVGSQTVARSSCVVRVSDPRGVDCGTQESEGRSGQVSEAGNTGRKAAGRRCF